MASMVRERSVSPSELVEAHLREIEERNPALNAFVEVFAERAREEARASQHPAGLLAGVPVTVKDSFDVAGVPTRAGREIGRASCRERV